MQRENQSGKPKKFGHMTADEYQSRLKAGTLETSSKYHNQKVEWGGMTFDSKWEWERYMVLVDMESKEKISSLGRQFPIVLQPAFVGGNGETVRAIKYFVDFLYFEERDGITRRIFEDAKGMETDVFKIKWKMLKYRYRSDAYTEFRLTKRGETDGNS